MKKILLSALSLILLSGCAVGPLVSQETARTVGQSNHELIGGYGMAGYVFKWNYGLSDKFDFGLQWEALSIGVRGKYAFINNGSGWSFAGALGTGTSVGGNHFYGDLIGSYLTGSWEPYGTVRIVRVKNDPIEFNDQDTGHVDFVIDKSEYVYGQFLIGTRYWFSPHWLLSIEASNLFAISTGIKFNDSLLAGASFGYRF